MVSSPTKLDGDLLELQLELRHKKPWHFADADSIWVVTGTYPTINDKRPVGGFRDCIARVLPSGVTGTHAPIFEILLYGDAHTVTAVDITAAFELLLVKAANPLAAYYECDQALIDAALERRDETR